MPFSATIALAVSLAFTGGSSQIQSTPNAVVSVMPQSQSVQQYIDGYFADEPIMAAIASCESHFEQFGPDGQVLKNGHSSAVGVFQIMSSVHASFADEKLGLDIDSLQGNAAYAQYLYQKEGTKPWDASKGCWSKSAAYKDMQADASAVSINAN